MDKCPCCESLRTKVFDPETNAKEFLCGSYLEHDNYFGRSTVCYERQIAALQEKVECLKDLHLEISALKERLEAWRTLAPELDWKVYEDGAISYMISGKHLKRLKALNEL